MKIYNFEFSKSVYQFCDVIIAKWKETLNEIVGKKNTIPLSDVK